MPESTWPARLPFPAPSPRRGYNDQTHVTDEILFNIGRYEVRREIGRGMMGIVYEAIDPALQRQVALKTISLGTLPGNKAEFEQRFLTEARVAARLHHPAVVVVHDVGRDETGVLFMALEYLEGQTLGDILDEGGLFEWREAVHSYYGAPIYW